MNIDPTTGLPELPEGYFFRVEETSVSILRNLPDTDWQEYDGSYDTYTHPGKSRWLESAQEFEYADKRTWYGRGYKVTSRVRWTNITELVSRAYVFDNEGFKTLITKDTLLETAQKALEDFVADRERKTLLGDYPPKKFGASA